MSIRILSAAIFLVFFFSLASQAVSQHISAYHRVARITVDKSRLNEYLDALHSQMNAALKNEKGVLEYIAVQEKDNPEKIIIFETYASPEAYQLHIQTEHFKKYKATVADMVLELELTDVVPVARCSKEKRVR